VAHDRSEDLLQKLSYKKAERFFSHRKFSPQLWSYYSCKETEISKSGNFVFFFFFFLAVVCGGGGGGGEGKGGFRRCIDVLLVNLKAIYSYENFSFY